MDSRHDAPDILVCIVTYNSSDSLADLVSDVLGQAGPLRLKVVVVDNDSRDGTPTLALGPDVTMIRAGRNAGYAAALNIAQDLRADARAILILNPDVRLHRDAVRRMWDRLWSPGVGVVVPKVLESDGRVAWSLRREPTLLRGLSDALLGDSLKWRPGWASETEYRTAAYGRAHAVDWATGAALMVRAGVADAVGSWNEAFFLYSEEVDYLRRVRSAGWQVWFEPDAVVVHAGQGSGFNPALAALMAVNRVRYATHFHGARYAGAVRATGILGAALRAPLDPGARRALAYLARRGSWQRLPHDPWHGRRDEAPVQVVGPLSGSVIIPAHDEQASIGAILDALAPLHHGRDIDVIVAANGCSDDTVEIARAAEGVTVLDLPVASKAAAIQAAEDTTARLPRVYLDADVIVDPQSIADVMRWLAAERSPAARPPYRYDTEGASWPVSAFYRTREQLPSTRSGLWGAGVYALSAAGRSRFGVFPDLLADDLFVDALFARDEVAIVETAPVVVRTPRSVPALRSVLRRTYRGNGQLAHHEAAAGRSPSGSTGSTGMEVLRTITSPAALVDAIVYVAFVLLGRIDARRSGVRWDRDLTSRQSGV